MAGRLKTVLYVLVAATTLLAGVQTPEPKDNKTSFVLSEPMEVPGTILPPGKYVIKLLPSEAHRNVLEAFRVVEIFDETETRLYASTLAMANYDSPPKDNSRFVFFEMGGAQLKALRVWYCPCEKWGEELLYPKVQAVRLADASHRGVLSLPSESPSLDIKTEETPSHATSAVTATLKREQGGSRAVVTPGSLPKTASYLYGFVFGGLLLLLAAFGIRGISKYLERVASRQSQLSVPESAPRLELILPVGRFEERFSWWSERTDTSRPAFALTSSVGTLTSTLEIALRAMASRQDGVGTSDISAPEARTV